MPASFTIICKVLQISKRLIKEQDMKQQMLELSKVSQEFFMIPNEVYSFEAFVSITQIAGNFSRLINIFKGMKEKSLSCCVRLEFIKNF